MKESTSYRYKTSHIEAPLNGLLEWLSLKTSNRCWCRCGHSHVAWPLQKRYNNFLEVKHRVTVGRKNFTLA